jgi:predicted methyltransferase
MISRKCIMLSLFGLLLNAACTGLPTRTAVAQSIDTALAGSHRSDAERARDRYRHPRETLLFFGLRPSQTVVEIAPGGGWYTKILAPVLRDQGRYIAALPPVVAANANSVRGRQNFLDLLASAPNLFDRVTVTDFDIGKGTLAPDGSVDLILTFRNVHSWMARERVAEAFRDMYRALKPGGTLGVVEHRGNETLAQDPLARSGYVNQSYAIRLIEGAGFRLIATSEINSNAKDTKDYPAGVWTLPPVLTAGEADREKYLAIGESDRFTLKFIKPR